MTDPFHEICEILREIGATLTYYGKPVTETEMRDIAERAVVDRLVGAMELAVSRWADDGGRSP